MSDKNFRKSGDLEKLVGGGNFSKTGKFSEKTSDLEKLPNETNFAKTAEISEKPADLEKLPTPPQPLSATPPQSLSATQPSAEPVIAAMDLGLSRIGLALCLRNIILPQEPVLRQNRRQAAAAVSEFLRAHRVQILVIGLCVGSPNEAEFRRRIEHFCGLLDFGGQIALVDESFSSREAATQVRSRRAGAKTGRQDSAAAAVILQRYLDQRRAK